MLLADYGIAQLGNYRIAQNSHLTNLLFHAIMYLWLGIGNKYKTLDKYIVICYNTYIPSNREAIQMELQYCKKFDFYKPQVQKAIYTAYHKGQLEEIASGIEREVYVINKDFVVKVSHMNYNAQQEREWERWQSMTEMQKKLCAEIVTYWKMGHCSFLICSNEKGSAGDIWQKKYGWRHRNTKAEEYNSFKRLVLEIALDVNDLHIWNVSENMKVLDFGFFECHLSRKDWERDHYPRVTDNDSTYYTYYNTSDNY